MFLKTARHHQFILMSRRTNLNRKPLVNLRISNDKRNIETGRYEKIRSVIEFEDEIEDEIHFLLDCPKYSSIRDDLFNKIYNRIPNNKHIPISTLIIQLMNCTDYYLNKQLVQYVSSCFEMRDNSVVIESLILLFHLLFVIVKMLLQCCNSLLWPCK